MVPYAIVIDDFLDYPDAVREYARTAEFKDHLNPVEGVMYPLINHPLPPQLVGEVFFKLSQVLGVKVAGEFIYLRLSTEGTPVYHSVHTDSNIGQWTMVLYLNEEKDCRGGTSLRRHKATGLARTPTTKEEEELWQREGNDQDAWETVMHCPMKKNRAFIYDSFLMHNAEPVGGFGKDATDGRLVCVANVVAVE